MNRWCKCGSRLLTNEQIEKNLPCETCQKHAKDFIEKFSIKKEDQDVISRPD